jgi:hypothetical protein
MKINLSKDSWHWRLATYYGGARYSSSGYCGPLAGYVTDVGVGALSAVLMTSAMGVFAAMVADFAAWLLACAVAGSALPMNGLTVVLVTIVALIACICSFAWIQWKMYSMRWYSVYVRE